MSLEQDFLSKCKISDSPSNTKIIVKGDNILNINGEDWEIIDDNNWDMNTSGRNRVGENKASDTRKINVNNYHPAHIYADIGPNRHDDQKNGYPNRSTKIKYVDRSYLSGMIANIKGIVSNIDYIIKFIVFVCKLSFIVVLSLTILRDVGVKIQSHRTALKMRNIRRIHAMNLNITEIGLDKHGLSADKNQGLNRPDLSSDVFWGFEFENDVCYTKVVVRFFIEILECFMDSLSFKSWLFIGILSIALCLMKIRK